MPSFGDMFSSIKGLQIKLFQLDDYITEVYIPYLKKRGILRKSKLFTFLVFQWDRLQERLGNKKTHAEYLNHIYNTRSWEMEKIYIDSIYGSAAINNIHFALTVFPILNKLNEHPYIYSQKFSQYCRSRPFLCIDYFLEGFKGLNAEELIINPYDRHINGRGNKIAAQILFEKLKHLIHYDHLDKIHGGFSLKELLEKNYFPIKVDEAFSKLKPGNSIELSKSNERLIFSKKSDQFIFKKSKVNLKTNSLLSQKLIILNQQGELRKRKTDFYNDNGNLKISIRLIKEDDKWIETLSKYPPDIKVRNLKPQKEKKAFIFKYKKYPGKEIFHITEKNRFYDPKSIEQTIFSDSLQIRGPEAENDIYGMLNYFRKGCFSFISWSDYSDSLSQDILTRKPSLAAIRAVERFFSTPNNTINLNLNINDYQSFN